MKRKQQKHSRRRTALLLAFTLTLFTPTLSAHAASYAEPAVGQSTTVSTGLNIRSQATTASAVIGTLAPGAYIQVIGESGDFYRVRYLDGIGYCSKRYIELVSEEYGVVTTASSSLNLRKSASTNSAVLAKLEKGSVVPVLSNEENGWYRIVSGTTIGFVSAAYFTEAAPLDEERTEQEPTAPEATSVRSRMVSRAESFLGTYYEWGGDVVANPNSYGFDCSHFTYQVMRPFGLIDYYRTSANQYAWCEKITRDELLPGDLVFYLSPSTGKVVHVTMYIGGGMIIGANGGISSTNTLSAAIARNAMVKIEPLDKDTRVKLYGRAPSLD